MADYQQDHPYWKKQEEPEARCTCGTVQRDFLPPAPKGEGHTALPEVNRGRAALPEVDSPDMLLDAGCCVQHLATAFPKAFEHHLHGVL